MTEGRDAQDPAGERPAADPLPPPLPPPHQLSVYSFTARYHALRLPLWLGLGAVTLVLMHMLLMAIYHGYAQDDPGKLRWYYVSVFDLGEEESVGTWFSAVTLLFIGRIAWGHGKVLWDRRDVWAGWWILIAIVFHVMSLEEVVNLHATLQEWFRRSGYEDLPGPPMRRVLLWTAGFVGAAMVPFLFSVSKRFAVIIVIAGAMYLAGALWIDWTHGSDLKDEYESGWAWYAAIYPWVALEEALELLAPIVFLHGMLAYLAGSPKGTVEHRSEVQP